MLPAEIVQQVRKVQIHTGRQVADVLAGCYEMPAPELVSARCCG